jgi:hypothetical protein
VHITDLDRIPLVNGALEEHAGAIGAALWGLESATMSAR